jgi:hypothetical protein
VVQKSETPQPFQNILKKSMKGIGEEEDRHIIKKKNGKQR